MTKTYLTVNGQPLGFLSPRDEEVYVAGKIAALAYLREKVKAMPARGVVYPYDIDSLVPETLLYRADVLALIDGSV